MAIQQNPFGKKNEKENKHKNMMGKKTNQNNNNI